MSSNISRHFTARSASEPENSMRARSCCPGSTSFPWLSSVKARRWAIGQQSVDRETSEVPLVDSFYRLARVRLIPSFQMKPVVLILAWVTFALRLCADSVVVFNEIHYHPAPEESRLQWIELKNQLSIDVDISSWSIEGEVLFMFPEGTVIRGRDFLVVALDPAALQFATGRTNITGPLEGSLTTPQGHLVLRNNQRRLMDEIRYSSSDPWPAAPDGHGPSLARRRGYPAPGDPLSWMASLELGGTPGRENFPTPPPAFQTNVWFTLGQKWRWRGDQNAPPPEWFTSTFDDSTWEAGSAPFQAGEPPLPILVGTLLPPTGQTHYFRTTWTTGPEIGLVRLALRGFLHDGAIGYINGVEAFRYNMPGGAVSHQTAARSDVNATDPLSALPIPAQLISPGRNLFAVEVHQGLRPTGYPQAILASRPVAYWRMEETNGLCPDDSQIEGSQDGSFAGLGLTN